MSRIGKKPIPLPNGVEATINESSVILKGPKGSLTIGIPQGVKVEMKNDPRELSVTVSEPDAKESKALWGLVRQLLANAIQGVQEVFEKSLEFVGVGFRVALAGRDLNLEVGFSHPVVFNLPEGIEAKVEKQIVTFSGIDKQLVGETAARVRRIRPPEPYKGKGIKYTTEVIRRKAGKTATKAGA
jgi:large subunit ribosomal protein L6